MNPPNRKRKRNYNDHYKKERTDAAAAAVAAVVTSSSIQTTPPQTPHQLLFRNKIVVITASQQSQSQQSQQQQPQPHEAVIEHSTQLDDLVDSQNSHNRHTNHHHQNHHNIHPTYKSLVSLLQDQWGATICRQVHTRVYCVIATASAVTPQPTQRVRQAWQRNIPVVTTQYIQDCIQQQTIIPIPTIQDIRTNHHIPNPYRILPPSSISKTVSLNTNTAKEQPSQQDSPDDIDDCDPTFRNIDVQERIVELGCCCICHDNDDDDTTTRTTTTNKTSSSNVPCEWCIDCSYTRPKPITS